MDPLRHPDLEHLSRELRNQLDDTLDAEQAAARSASVRRRTLRDRLLEAEDRCEQVVLATSDGHFYRGMVGGVGVDHVIIQEGTAERFVSVGHIVSLEAR